MDIRMNLGERSYTIAVERGSLGKVSERMNLNRKALIVTDSGVPYEYAQTVANQTKDATVAVIEQGEASKNFENYQKLLKKMVENNFTRGDCVVAVGGGVVGDLAGFVAASYMRGVDFYNIPTTLLSQIDSSIGGKVAVDFEGYKNLVGVFYQPKQVVIDPDVLKTLSKRQFASGLAEAIKMALTFNRDLFELIEQKDISENIDTIIVESLKIKRDVVEQDEQESGLRAVLNFGHTIGHGIESEQKGNLFHGECVALGMLPMCSPSVRERLIPVLKKAALPCAVQFDKEQVYRAILHDKKCRGNQILVIKVNEIGSFVTEKTDADNVRKLLDAWEETR